MTKIGDTIKTSAETAKAKASQTTAAAKLRASEALDTSREAALHKVEQSRDLARKAKAKTGDSIDNNPLAIVLGGVAIGAIIGALLPSTEREVKVLGKAGKKLNKKAKKMAAAAKAAGKDKVDSLGLNADMVRDQFRELVGKAAEAVKAAGQAASDAAKKD